MMRIRRIELSEIDMAVQLIWEVFLEVFLREKRNTGVYVKQA